MKYKKAFRDIDAIKMNPYLDCSEPNFWLSCMTINEGSSVKPLDIMLALEKENIESRPIWKPMHMQPVYKDADMIVAKEGTVCEKIFDRGLCLPSDIKNTNEDMDRIISIIRGVFGRS